MCHIVELLFCLYNPQIGEKMHAIFQIFPFVLRGDSPGIPYPPLGKLGSGILKFCFKLISRRLENQSFISQEKSSDN